MYLFCNFHLQQIIILFLKRNAKVILQPTDTAKKAKDTTSDDKIRIYKISLEGAKVIKQNHGLHNAVSKNFPYLNHLFTYFAKSGFYIGTSDQFLLVKKNGGFDVFGLNLVWSGDLTDNTTVNLNFQSIIIFEAKTPNLLIQSSLSSDIESYISQDLCDFTGKLTLDYDIYNTVKNQPQNT